MIDDPTPKRALSGDGDDAQGLDDIYRDETSPRPTRRVPRLDPIDDATVIRPRHVHGPSSSKPSSTPKTSSGKHAPCKTSSGGQRPPLITARGRLVFIVVALLIIFSATTLTASWSGTSLVWLIGAPLMVVAVLVGVLGRTAAFTLASTILPGLGLLGSRSPVARIFGVVFPLALLGAIAWAGFSAYTDLAKFASFAVKPSELRRLSVGLIVAGLIWVALIAITHLSTRPRGWSWGRRALGAVLVSALSFSVAGSAAIAARYAYDQTKLVTTVFAPEEDVKSTSRPSIEAEEPDPWRNNPRINILLIGADSKDNRNPEFGLRADTIMVASVDTATGATTLIQIPRNVQYTPFPEGSDLDKRYPRGFRGEGDPALYYINALWNAADDYFPDVFEGQTFPNAEGMKQGVEGITGLKIDYFTLLNIDGVQRFIDAMGGVDVNINRRLPIAGDSEGKPPTGYLEQGPDQHLDGYNAMWYARSRSDSDDFERMGRQSCLVGAIIKQANPATVLSSYESIAAASADMVMTDIPQQVLEPLVGLSLKIKDAEITRLVFAQDQNGYNFSDPDFDAMRQAVQDAIDPPPPPPSATALPSPTGTPSAQETPTPPPGASATPTIVDGAQDVADACAYNPVEPSDANQVDEDN